MFAHLLLVASADDDAFGTGHRSVLPTEDDPALVDNFPDNFSGEDRSGLRSVGPVLVEGDDTSTEKDVVSNVTMNSTTAGEFCLPRASLRRVPAVNDLPGLLAAAVLGQGADGDDPPAYDDILEMHDVPRGVVVGNATEDASHGPIGEANAGGVIENAGGVIEAVVDVVNDVIDLRPEDSSSEEFAFADGAGVLNSSCMLERRRSHTDDRTDESGIPEGTFQVKLIYCLAWLAHI